MAKWHYNKLETIEFQDKKDHRNGQYYEYDADTFDYLINSNDWVHVNDAWDEQQYVRDNLDKMLESNDGTLIFIPTGIVSMTIDAYYELEDQKYW